MTALKSKPKKRITRKVWIVDLGHEWLGHIDGSIITFKTRLAAQKWAAVYNGIVRRAIFTT